MTVHQPTGRWQLGLALALVPAALWGALPIAIKIVLQEMDGATIAWYRLTGSGLVLAALLAARGRLPALRDLTSGDRWLLFIAGAGLAGNYLCWQLGLRTISPATAAVIVQVAPLFLAAGAMLVFGERFSRSQWLGAGLLLGGLATFFHEQLAALLGSAAQQWLGALLTVAAALSWTFYALAQKQLLRKMGSPQIMVLVYFGSGLLLWPGTRPALLLSLDPLRLALLLSCIANTLLAYGALAEALVHWDASRVSAILPLSPLFTIAFMSLVARWWPGLVAPERLTLIGLAGAIATVAGAMLTALSGRPSLPPPEA